MVEIPLGGVLHDEIDTALIDKVIKELDHVGMAMESIKMFHLQKKLLLVLTAQLTLVDHLDGDDERRTATSPCDVEGPELAGANRSTDLKVTDRGGTGGLSSLSDLQNFC